jgi:hypothetical protein
MQFLISMGQFRAPWGAILMPKHQRMFGILAALYLIIVGKFPAPWGGIGILRG